MSRRKVRRARRHTERTVEEAFEELEAGNRTLALRLARRAREEGGMNVRVLFDCATIAHACGEHAEAADTLRALLAQAPDHAEACALFAELRASAGRPAAALRWLRRALALEPGRASWREREAELVALAMGAPDAAPAANEPHDDFAGGDAPAPGAPGAGDRAERGRDDGFGVREARDDVDGPGSGGERDAARHYGSEGGRSDDRAVGRAVPRVASLGAPLPARLQRLDAAAVAAEVLASGHATLPGVLRADERGRLLALLATGEGLEHPHRLRSAIGGDAAPREGAGARTAGAAGAPACTVHWLQSPLPGEIAALQRELHALAAIVANVLLARLGEAPRHPLAFDDHRPRPGRPAVRLVHCDAGAELPPQRTEDRAAFPLRVLFDLGPDTQPAAPDEGRSPFPRSAPSLVLTDVRPGKKRRATAASTRPGDAVLFCCRARLQSIAGVFGLQLVHWSAGPFPQARTLLDLAFDDE